MQCNGVELQVDCIVTEFLFLYRECTGKARNFWFLFPPLSADHTDHCTKDTVAPT
jgi:hypothetical protein